MAENNPKKNDPDANGSGSNDSDSKDSGSTDSGSSQPDMSACVEVEKRYDAFWESCKENDLKDAKADATVAITRMAGALKAVSVDHCAWEKGEETREFYSQLHHNVALGLSSDMATAQKCVSDFVAMSDDIKSTYAEAIAKMKETQEKLTTVCNLAKNWTIDVKKTCNGQNKKELNKVLKDRNSEPSDIVEKAEGFEELAGTLVDSGDQVKETAVKVVGIYSFVNVASLEPCFADLAEAASTFQKDTETNLKASEDQISAALKQLTTDIPLMSERYFGQFQATANWKGIYDQVKLLETSFPPELPRKEPETLSEICKLLSKPVNDSSEE